MKIRYKLLFVVLLSVILILGAFGFITYRYSSQALKKQIESGGKCLVEAKMYELNGILGNIQDIAKSLGLALENIDTRSKDDVKNLIKSLLESEPQAYGSTIAFVPGAFDPEDEYFAPYYHRSAQQGLMYVDLGKVSYNYTTWDWFKIPLETNKPYWTEPYIDEGGGEIAMTTYSFPFHKNGKVWGIATVDLSLAELTKIIDQVRPTEHGYAFLLSKNGTILSLIKDEWEMKKSVFDVAKDLNHAGLEALGQKMTAGETGFMLLDDPLLQVKAWFAFSQIPTTKWSLGIVIPEDEVDASLIALHRNMLIIGIAGIILLFIVLFLISDRITKPIRYLAEKSKKIADGDLSTSLKRTNTKDEIGKLTNSFADMQSSLSKTLTDLSEEKEMFRIAFSQMSDGLLILNKDTEVLQLNKVAENMLGLQMHDNFIDSLKQKFESTLDLDELKSDLQKEINFKLSRTETDDLDSLNLLFVFTPVCDQSGKLVESIVSFRNITNEEKEEQSKRNFLSIISHKLFTPLTVLEGKLMLLKDGLLGQLDEKQQKNTDDMVNQSGKLRALIEKLVNFVTLEESDIDMSKENINLKEFMEEQIVDAKKWFNDKNIEIKYEIDTNESVLFNKKYLRLIVGQLIDNGLKFNMSDPAKILIKCTKDDKYETIQVSDNGIGIPPEFIDKIFEKFFQIEKYHTGNVEGVGLGLSYVAKIVNHFEGKINVESKTGSGSAFTISLPI